MAGEKPQNLRTPTPSANCWTLVFISEGSSLGFRVHSAPAMRVLVSMGMVETRRRAEIASSKYRGTEACIDEGVAACPVLCPGQHLAFPSAQALDKSSFEVWPQQNSNWSVPFVGTNSTRHTLPKRNSS
jgi:hypothetical protein